MRRGFTLLELTVAMTILAIMLAVSAPAWRPSVDASPSVVAATRVVELLRAVQRDAVVRGRSARLVVKAATAQARVWPADSAFMLALPEGCALAEDLDARFDADGPARAGAMHVRCVDGSQWVRVDALSGQPRVEPGR